jgi:hypothetical protein
MEQGYVDLSQEAYCREMVFKAFGKAPEELIPVATPETNETLTKSQAPTTTEDIEEMQAFGFREHGGRALYNMTCCRPPISHSLKMVLQFSSNPGVAHKRALLRIIRYISGCCGARLRLHGSRDYRVALGVICDSDDANNPDHRRSLNAVLSFIGNYFVVKEGVMEVGTPAFFDWSSSWTVWVAESSCVSELYAIALSLRKVKYFRPFINELASKIIAIGALLQVSPTAIFSDCESAITIAQGSHPGRFKGTKHIERRFFSIQQAIEEMITIMARAASSLNVADILATYKNKAVFVIMRNILMGNVYAPPMRPFKLEQQTKSVRFEK